MGNGFASCAGKRTAERKPGVEETAQGCLDWLKDVQPGNRPCPWGTVGVDGKRTSGFSPATYRHAADLENAGGLRLRGKQGKGMCLSFDRRNKAGKRELP